MYSIVYVIVREELVSAPPPASQILARIYVIKLSILYKFLLYFTVALTLTVILSIIAHYLVPDANMTSRILKLCLFLTTSIRV